MGFSFPKHLSYHAAGKLIQYSSNWVPHLFYSRKIFQWTPWILSTMKSNKKHHETPWISISLQCSSRNPTHSRLPYLPPTPSPNFTRSLPLPDQFLFIQEQVSFHGDPKDLCSSQTGHLRSYHKMATSTLSQRGILSERNQVPQIGWWNQRFLYNKVIWLDLFGTFVDRIKMFVSTNINKGP